MTSFFSFALTFADIDQHNFPTIYCRIERNKHTKGPSVAGKIPIILGKVCVNCDFSLAARLEPLSERFLIISCEGLAKGIKPW